MTYNLFMPNAFLPFWLFCCVQRSRGLRHKIWFCGLQWEHLQQSFLLLLLPGFRVVFYPVFERRFCFPFSWSFLLKVFKCFFWRSFEVFSFWLFVSHSPFDNTKMGIYLVLCNTWYHVFFSNWQGIVFDLFQIIDFQLFISNQILSPANY